MRNLNPDQLQALVAIVDKGGFTQAAKALNLTQPAISLQIRELEARCGISLLDRDGRKPKPTAAGEALLSRARKILAEHEAALAVMRRHKDGAAGRLRIGMSTTTLTHLAGPALRQLRSEQPTLQLAVAIETSPKLADLVRDNDLDLALVTLPLDATNLTVTVLFEEDLVAILPRSTVAPPRQATPAYLAEQPFIVDPRTSVLRRALAKWFQDAAVEQQPALQLEHLEAIKGAVAAGLGASIVPRLLVRDPSPSITVLPLEPRLSRELAVIRRTDGKPNAASRSFLDALQPHLPKS